jgi:rhodanese-related sulfurtransferase
MNKSYLFGYLWMGMLLAAASAQTANLPGDAEAAPHGDEAADVQLVEVRAVIMEAGGDAWIAEGQPTLIAAGSGHGSAAPAARSVKLPQRIAAAELKRMLMDLPGTFEIVDVRPPEQYADFSLPGSINADIADVIAEPDYLNGTVPLIIVDRDGSLAMAVGGILSQRTQRSIRVLYGGLEAYWSDSAAPLPSVAPGPASVPAVKPAAPGQAPATPAAPGPAAPETPKKKSAGC